MYERHRFGSWAEDTAHDYLTKQGLVLVERNFRYKKMGEIDLIMTHQHQITHTLPTLVFVEVRARKDNDLLRCLESITPFKRHKLTKTALIYLTEKKILYKQPCRFDVVAICDYNNVIKIHWIKGAFEINDRYATSH